MAAGARVAGGLGSSARLDDDNPATGRTPVWLPSHGGEPSGPPPSGPSFQDQLELSRNTAKYVSLRIATGSRNAIGVSERTVCPKGRGFWSE